MGETLTIRTSASTDVIKVVERGPQGATGPQGPAGEGGASTWDDITGKPATFPPSAHDHQPVEVYADAAFVSQTGGSGRGGIYLRNGADNGKPLYESPATGDYIWWDSDFNKWYLTSRPGVNLFQITDNTDNFPWETDTPWAAIAPQTGNVEVDQATLFDVSDYSSTSVIGLKTSKSGNASSDELVLGSDTRLTNSRTPSAHASTHHTGGSDALTPANIGAAQAVNVIELTPSPGSTTITTSQLPARGIAYIEGGGSFTVNLPTPDVRQSGLTFSIKVEHESFVTGAVFVTVVHNASDLLTSYELDEAESSLDFLWDGYRWTYSSSNWLYSYPNRRLSMPVSSGTLGLSEPADNVFRVVGSADATKKVAFEVDGLTTGTTRTLTVPNANGTIALTSDFAAPPSIGNTTPAAGTFTTLAANNGTLTASAPVLDLAQTWNASGVTFTGLRLNVTNTASALASWLVDFQIGGSTQFGVTRGGHTAVRGLRSPNTSDGIFIGGLGEFNSASLSVFSNSVRTNRDAHIGWTPDTNHLTAPDLQLHRDAADTLAQRRTTNPQAFRLYNTYTDASNHERGFMRWSSNVLQIGTEKAGTGSARGMVFQTDGVTRMTIATDGTVSFPAAIQLDSSGLVLQAATSFVNFANDCIVRRDEADVFAQRRTTSPQTYRLYNTFASTSSFERLNIRWASNECIIDAQAGSSGGTLRGIKLGSATSSLLGFYGATPVDRPATVADPTGGGTVDAEARTAINDIIDRLQELGLIA